jgi:hypothetical protein
LFERQFGWINSRQHRATPTFVGEEPSDEGRFRDAVKRFQPPHRDFDNALKMLRPTCIVSHL